MTNLVERLRFDDGTIGDKRLGEAADRIEDLENQLLSINPAIKCRTGCAVVMVGFGSTGDRIGSASS